MAESCTVTMNGSSDEFATEAKLVKLVGSWVEAEEAALLQDGMLGTTVVMMSTAVAVLVVAAYLRNTMLSRGEKAVLYSLQWVFPLQGMQAFSTSGSKITLNPPTRASALIGDKSEKDESPGHADEAVSDDERRKSKRMKKVKSVLARRAKALKKKKVVHRADPEPEPLASESEAELTPVEEVQVQELEVEQVQVEDSRPEVEQVQVEDFKPEQDDVADEDSVCEEIEQTTKSCLVARSACARRSQSAPSVVFAEPLTTEGIEEEARPVTVPPAAPAARIPTPREEVSMVRLVLGQEPFEVDVEVRECDLNLSAPTVSFLRCKGFITWCRDDIKGECQWGNRCRYAHVADEELRNYLMSVLPPIPSPLCPQDFHCNQLNDLYHQAQYRHTCRIPNCQNSQEMWHAIPFYHPPAVPKSMPLSCYTYGAPFDMTLNTYGSPVIEPVDCTQQDAYGADY